MQHASTCSARLQPTRVAVAVLTQDVRCCPPVSCLPACVRRYLACGTCIGSGVDSTTGQACSVCAGTGKVMCTSCLATGKQMASEHDRRIDPFLLE